MGVRENIVGGGDILDGKGGGGGMQVDGGGRGMNDCEFGGNIQLWRCTTGDGNLEVASDKGIAGALYNDNRSVATLGALCGVSSKMVNRSKGLGHRRRRGVTQES